MSPKSVRSEAASSHQHSASPVQRLDEVNSWLSSGESYQISAVFPGSWEVSLAQFAKCGKFCAFSRCKGSEYKILTFQIQHNANDDDISDSLPPPPPPPPGEHLSPSPCPPHHHQQQMQQQMQQQQQQQQQLGMTMCTSPRPPQNRQVAIIHNPEVQVRYWQCEN